MHVCLLVTKQQRVCNVSFPVHNFPSFCILSGYQVSWPEKAPDGKPLMMLPLRCFEVWVGGGGGLQTMAEMFAQ